MSVNVTAARGGDFATSRRGGIALDMGFIQERRKAGFPISAIARMVNRNQADVAKLCEEIDGQWERQKEEEKPPVLYAVPRRPPERERTCKARGHSRLRSMPDIAKLYVKDCCERRDATLDEILGDNQTRHVSQVRDEVYWVLSQAGYNNCEIGQFIGARDPSTVLVGIRRHVARMGMGVP